jgi:hypothetical protein
MGPRRYAITLFGFLACCIAACSTYQTTHVAPAEAVVGQDAVEVALVGAESRLVTVTDPWVRGDSLGGTVGEDTTWAVPVSSIAVLHAKQTDVTLTAVTIGGAAVAIGVAIYAATQ